MNSLNVKPLIYYFYINGTWEKQELPVAITELRIGSNPDFCEIQMDSDLADEVQVLLKRIGDIWYFFELGTNPMMKVNGILKRQGQLHPKRSVVIQINNISLIFSTKQDKIVLYKTSGSIQKMGPPQEQEFSLKHNLEEFSYAYDLLCLLGVNPLCNFTLNTQQPFCGFINYQDGIFHFYSLINKNEILISKNGLNVKKSVLLKAGDVLVIDGSRIEFNSGEIIVPEEENSLPGKETLALLQLNENGTIQQTYRLPELGSSIYVGRSATLSHIALEGSRKISRQHAQIVVFENKIQLVTLGAKNGLYVNEEEIQNVYVNPGDLIRMADLVFTVGFA